MTQQGLARLAIDTRLATDIICGFIRDQTQKAGLPRAVIALSGGIDSALAAALSARALGPENVLAIRMPWRDSSANSLSDADLLIEALGLPALTVEITPMVSPLFERFPEMDARRRGNIMARQRMIVSYDQSVAWGGLVMGTSNKTEFLLGYSTIYGDSGSAMQPIADLYKAQVRQLSAALDLPQSILDKAPSADLWEGQTDEEELGFRYEDVDQVLYLLVDERYVVDEVVEEGFARDFVEDVWRRVKANHYKRTMPNVARVSKRALGHAATGSAEAYTPSSPGPVKQA